MGGRREGLAVSGESSFLSLSRSLPLSLFGYILFMDLLGHWGMLLHQLQTLPYLTNQSFDVAEIRGSLWSACQTKMAADTYVRECEISKRRQAKSSACVRSVSSKQPEKGQDNWCALNDS